MNERRRRRPAGNRPGSGADAGNHLRGDARKGHPARPMRGRVEYIHPRGRFHIVAFEVRGKTIKETFQGVEV